MLLWCQISVKNNRIVSYFSGVISLSLNREMNGVPSLSLENGNMTT